MSGADLEAEQQHLGPKLRFLLWQFEGRTLDDACLAEMAKKLNLEVTAIHKRIFGAVDANKDGKVTIEEAETFMRE